MRSTDQDQEASRRRLLDAAHACIKQVGFAGTSEALLCERAKLTRGGLHYHFKRGKVDLLIALAEELYERSFQRIAASQQQGPQQALLAAIDEAIATEAGGVVDDQRVLVELWLGARSSDKMAATLGVAIDAVRQRYWSDLQQRTGADWNPTIARYGFLFRTFLRGAVVERSAGEGEAQEHLVMLKILRGWITRAIEEGECTSTK